MPLLDSSPSRARWCARDRQASRSWAPSRSGPKRMRARRPHAADRARPRHRRLARRPRHRRGDAQPPTAASGSTGCGTASPTPASVSRPPTASASCASSRTMSAPRCIPAAREYPRSCPARASGSRGLIPPVVQAACFAIRKPRRRGVHPGGLRGGRDHDQAPGRGPSRRRRRAPQRARRRRHVDRQDDAGQRAAGRGRQDRRPRGPDRGHARAAVRSTQPGGAPHQGRRRLAVRAGALVAASSPRPHPDRRGARRRGAGPAQGLGHRPSRRGRHHPRRLRARGAAPPRAAPSRKRCRPCRAP